MLKGLTRCARLLLATAAAIFAGWTVFSLPALLALPRALRPGLADVSIDEEAARLALCGASGWDLIERARSTTAERMQYCRRNSCDHFSVAFRRGYGFCQQQAYALSYLLRRLGFDAGVVFAPRCRFRNGLVLGHTWVRVSHDGETRDMDLGNTDPAIGRMDFEILSGVREMGPGMRLLSGWGSAGVNAYLWYRTGTDHGSLGQAA